MTLTPLLNTLSVLAGGGAERAAGRGRDPAAERGAALAGGGRRLHGRHPLRLLLHLPVLQPLPAGMTVKSVSAGRALLAC